MKRSEAVTKLSKELYTWVGLENEYRNRMADYLLSFITNELGLSPPNRPTLVPNPNIKTDYDLSKLSALVIKNSQTWEMENNFEDEINKIWKPS